jgi:hypothetical protein
VILEEGQRDESSRAVVRPITPAPRMMKSGVLGLDMVRNGNII